MRTFVLMLAIAGTTALAFSARRVTVDQLDHLLAAGQGKPDREIARQLSDLELTERLSTTALSHCDAALPGPESRQALTALAAQSAFLDLPVAELPTTPAPDIPTQRRIMAAVIDYAAKMLSRLPNFFATRVITRFEDSPRRYENARTSFTPYQPVHRVGQSSDTVLFRDGNETVDAENSKHKKLAEPRGLVTRGVFGPILGTVLVDAAQGTLVWSHWEPGDTGPLAVFRYAVPTGKSHYAVEYCCLDRSGGSFGPQDLFHTLAGYHGEIAVDPASGTILRLTLQANLKADEPIVSAGIVVEYGPVEIGGKTYTCPLKSVSLLRVWTAQTFSNLPSPIDSSPRTLAGDQQLLLNDVAFERYHLFRAEARVLPNSN